MAKQLSIGITGGIGSGKSTVAKVIESFGYPVFYSDAASKKLLVSSANTKALKKLFGESVFTDNVLDKNALANVVFNNSEKLEALNQLMHPQVRQAFNAWRSKQNTAIVFNEAAILFESGAYLNFDANILVCAKQDIRIQRIMQRDNSSVKAIMDRMAKQWSDLIKKPLADYIITNNGEALIPQVDNILKSLLPKN